MNKKPRQAGCVQVYLAPHCNNSTQCNEGGASQKEGIQFAGACMHTLSYLHVDLFRGLGKVELLYLAEPSKGACRMSHNERNCCCLSASRI